MEPKKKTRKKKHILRKIILWLIVLLLLAGLAYYGYTSLKQEYTVTYDSYTASIGSISNSLSFSGSLSLIDSKSYQATSGGTVRNVYVAEGDMVEEGDKILRLSNGETIEADFDGKVNRIYVEKDDTVSAGTQLAQIADFTHMKVSIRVDEYDISDVSVGQACTVTATATEQTFASSISSIDYISASGGNVAYYTAIAYVDVSEETGVYPGMQVTVTIPQEEATDVVILKMDALSFDAQNSAYVWMYDENEELTQVPVTVGVSNGNYVEITSGLADGDTVYVEVETEADASGLAGLFSGLFGSQEMNAPQGGFGGGGDMSGMSNIDMSNMPDMSSMGGGSAGGGGGFSGGGGGGFGGGN